MGDISENDELAGELSVWEKIMVGSCQALLAPLIAYCGHVC